MSRRHSEASNPVVAYFFDFFEGAFCGGAFGALGGGSKKPLSLRLGGGFGAGAGATLRGRGATGLGFGLIAFFG